MKRREPVKRFSLRTAAAGRAGRLSPDRHTLTWTFALLGLIIFLFITVPLLKMLLASVAETEILWKTLVDPQVVEAIWLTLYYHPMIAPVLVFERFEAFGLDAARPVAVLLVIVSVLVFVVLRVLINRGRQA
jgi:ABC-type sulfate transport system permease component